jgi:hypothetical protein
MAAVVAVTVAVGGTSGPSASEAGSHARAITHPRGVSHASFAGGSHGPICLDRDKLHRLVHAWSRSIKGE